MASGIAQDLAQTVPTDMQRHLGALSVRVQVPAGATKAEMSDAVAEAIMRALRKCIEERSNGLCTFTTIQQ